MGCAWIAHGLPVNRSDPAVQRGGGKRDDAVFQQKMIPSAISKMVALEQPQDLSHKGLKLCHSCFGTKPKPKPQRSMPARSVHRLQPLRVYVSSGQQGLTSPWHCWLLS
eukprot:1145631-Pelagomonas_calceolata.AAC.7